MTHYSLLTRIFEHETVEKLICSIHKQSHLFLMVKQKHNKNSFNHNTSKTTNSCTIDTLERDKNVKERILKTF